MQLLSVEDAAHLLAISAWTVRAYLKNGKLFPVRIGRRTLLEMAEIERFVQESKVPQESNHNLKEAAQCEVLNSGGISHGSNVSNN